MANWPGSHGNTPHEPGWGDPDAATRAVPTFERPGTASANIGGNQPPPAHHNPWIGQQPGPQAGYPHQQPDMPAAKRGRGRLLMALATVVVLLGGVVAYIRISDVDSAGPAGTQPSATAQNTQPTSAATAPSAAQTVTDYLEALRRGDATKALSYSKTPFADNEFLTDEVLSKQIAQWPISDIHIGEIKGDEQTAAKLYVPISAKFGDKTHSETIGLTRSLQGGWWIDHVANEYALHSSAVDATLTVFGKKLSPGQSFYAFPGYLDLASSNEYIEVTATQYPLFRNYLLSSEFLISADADLNSKGADAITAAVRESFAQCEKSNLIAPPDCPAQLNSTAAVDGTVTWGRADIDKPSFTLFSADLSVSVSGNASIPVTFQTTDGQTVSDTQLLVFQEKADITTSPPRLVR